MITSFSMAGCLWACFTCRQANLQRLGWSAVLLIRWCKLWHGPPSGYVLMWFTFAIRPFKHTHRHDLACTCMHAAGYAAAHCHSRGPSRVAQGRPAGWLCEWHHVVLQAAYARLQLWTCVPRGHHRLVCRARPCGVWRHCRQSSWLHAGHGCKGGLAARPTSQAAAAAGALAGEPLTSQPQPVVYGQWCSVCRAVGRRAVVQQNSTQAAAAAD